ncbi:GntR family transcriptional regulator [Flintibacter sp. P01028]|uniref:GntR family transcriptional regulator n=1 Tax=Flintibacter sp. P01028 TaxID=3342382 RepID=UPI0035B625BB
MATNLTIARNTIVRSTSDFVYNSVRQSILTHEFPAGSRLVEAKTSKELNVSITPVREAFARLANQGLLTVFPYKGTYVTIITKQYLEDVYFLRRHLEVMAAEKSFPKLTDQDIQYYEELFASADEAYDRQDLYESIRSDVLFHERLFTLSGSALLMDTWHIIKYRIENLQSYTKPVMNARFSVRHGAMLEAIRNKDQARYVAAFLEHLNTNQDVVDFPDEADIKYN